HPGGNLVRVWARLSPQPGLRAAEGLEVLEEEEHGLGVVLGHDDVVVGRLAGVRPGDQLANKLEHELVRARASRLGGLDTEGVVALRDGGEGRVGLVDERAPVDALSHCFVSLVALTGGNTLSSMVVMLGSSTTFPSCSTTRLPDSTRSWGPMQSLRS